MCRTSGIGFARSRWSGVGGGEWAAAARATGSAVAQASGWPHSGWRSAGPEGPTQQWLRPAIRATALLDEDAKVDLVRAQFWPGANVLDQLLGRWSRAAFETDRELLAPGPADIDAAGPSLAQLANEVADGVGPSVVRLATRNTASRHDRTAIRGQLAGFAYGSPLIRSGFFPGRLPRRLLVGGGTGQDGRQGRFWGDHRYWR